MSHRYGKEHAALPYCLRTLPENRPKDYHEFMIRRRVIPDDPDNYFDDQGRYLYDSKPIAQELEELKSSKRSSFEFVKRQTEEIKSLLLKKKSEVNLDLEHMKRRLRKAHLQHAKALAKTNSAAANDDSSSSKPSTKQ